MTIKTRSFVFTNWNIDFNYADLLASCRQLRYVAYGEETCPTSGRAHHQGFLYFHNQRTVGPRALGAIGAMFRQKEHHVHANIQMMRGSLLENESYCSKETAGVLREFGDKPEPGARGDIKEVVKGIVEGTLTPDSVALSDPAFYHQYGRTLERVETIALRKRWRTWMTEGLWIVGPANAGKSHMAFQGYHPDTHYIKNLNEEWWDGYRGQHTVILNEFRGQIKFSELLDLVDKWPKCVKWRCRESVPFLAKKVIVASVLWPKDVYRRQLESEPWAQFDRRFTVLELGARPLD